MAKAKSPLAHLIPDAPYYVSRKFDGVVDVKLLNYAGKIKANTLLFGPTGPGKTTLVRAYCAAKQIPLCTIQCHGAVDPATFWGSLILDPTTDRYVWQDSDATRVIREGGVLYFDEVNFLPAKVAANLHGLLDARRQITILEKGNELVKAHEDLQIIVAYNPDYEGTRPLNAAFKNRFKIKLQMDYDPEVESQILAFPVLQEIAARLRHAQRVGDLETPVSTNMLIEFEELALDLGMAFAMSNFINAFPETERKPVKDVLELYRDTLDDQLQQVEESSEDA